MMTMNHVHLGTQNIESAIKFYENYFQFWKKSNHGEGVFLINKAGFLIAIDPVENLPTLPDWYHLGFCLNSKEDVLKLYESMKANGVKIVRDLAMSPDEFASFFVKDPDGNKIEISWHNE